MTQPDEPLLGVGLGKRKRSGADALPHEPSPALDEPTRARIRAEELERAKVREEIAAEQRIKQRPSYWTGLALNLFLSGAGLMYLGRVGHGLAWLLGSLALAFLVSPWVAWPVGVLGSLYQYDSIYGRLFATQSERESEESASKLTPWLIGFVVVVIGGLYLLF